MAPRNQRFNFILCSGLVDQMRLGLFVFFVKHPATLFLSLFGKFNGGMCISVLCMQMWQYRERDHHHHHYHHQQKQKQWSWLSLHRRGDLQDPYDGFQRGGEGCREAEGSSGSGGGGSISRGSPKHLVGVVAVEDGPGRRARVPVVGGS